MVEKYYLSFRTTTILLIAVAIPLFFSLIAISTIINLVERLFVIIFIILVVLITILGKKIKITGLELSEYGLRINPFIWLSNISFRYPRLKRFVRWDDVRGMLISHYSFGHQKSIYAKIIIKNSAENLTCLCLNSSIFEKSNELFETLKTKIPDITNTDEIFLHLLHNFVSPSKIQFKDWILSEEGLLHPKGIIPWSSVKSIDYTDVVRRVSGYCEINITYQNQKDQLDNITIVPEEKEQFKIFLQFLIKKANKASIDPLILMIFESSYKKERQVIKLFVFSVITILIFFFACFIYVVFFKYQK